MFVNVIGTTDDQMHRSFINIVSSQIVGQKSESNDTRRIEISQFLHLAVVAYHQTQLNGDANENNGRSSNRRPGGGGIPEDELKEDAYSLQLSDIANSREIDEYYDLPADDELAAGLDYGEDTERDTIMTNKSPKSKSSRTQNETPGYMLPSSKSKISSKDNNFSPTTNQKGKKKIVPVPKSTKKRFSNASDENIGEAWGEGGFYHDVMSPTSPAKSSQDTQNKNNNNLNQETSNNQYDKFYDNYINNNINSTNNQSIEKFSPEFKSLPANLDDNQIITQTKMSWDGNENGNGSLSTNQIDQDGSQETSIINHREEQEYMNIQLDREKEFMGVCWLFFTFILFYLFIYLFYLFIL